MCSNVNVKRTKSQGRFLEHGDCATLSPSAKGCLSLHTFLPYSFFQAPCISKVWKCIFYARECSFWCISVIWPAIIEFIMIKNVWIYHTWFSCEDNFSRVSEALNLGAGQCVLCMHESKLFNFILAIILAMASSGASGGKTSDWRAVGIECHGCQGVFFSGWRYNQHRRSAYLRELCWARYQQNEPVCKAAPELLL